jgi:hypothetical protein
MGEFSDGYRIAEELHALRDLITEHLDHPGAHPSAFAAHGASPGVVDDAERTAAEIISNAETVAEGLVDSAESVADMAQAAADAAIESTAEVAATGVEDVGTVAGGTADVVTPAVEAGGEEESTPEGAGERAPHRPPHPLMRRIGG